MKYYFYFLLVLRAIFFSIDACAQGEYSNWYFGQQAALRFTAGGSPQPLLASAMTATSGCATLSDAAGNLLLYTNGEQVWNRQHQVMPGGQALGGNTQVAQGCAIVRIQGLASPTAYLFTQRVPQPLGGNTTGIPTAAEIQLNGAGGLGEVVRTGLPVVADTILQRLGERQFAPYQALVRHANGRDCWLLTRLHQQGVFMATLLDGSGQWPCARTVVSRVLPTRGPSFTVWAGALVASPDGRTLLYNDVATSFLLRFDPATGQVSTPVQLAYPASTIPAIINPYALSGIFSASGTCLYLSRHYQPTSSYGNSASQIIQYNLSAGTPATVASSGIEIYNVATRNGTSGVPWYGQRGPDGIIYFALNESFALDAILSPNLLGRACRYSVGYRSLGGRRSLQSLPVQPNDVNMGALLAPEAAFGCAGQPLTLRAGAGAGGVGSDSLRWLLGDGRPAIGTVATADTLVTSYPTPGTYSLRIERRRQGTVVASSGATVQISPSPRVQLALASDTVSCAPLNLRLSAGIQPPGSYISWQDGSTNSTFLATTPGIYWVDVQNPAGCTVRATVRVRERPCPVAVSPPDILHIPNIITPNNDLANQTFTLQGLRASDWALRIHNRWGREIYTTEKYDNSWAAPGQPNGLYYYLLTNAQTGQQYKGWVEVAR